MCRRGGRGAVACIPSESCVPAHAHAHTLLLIGDLKAPLGLCVVPEGHFPGPW